MKSPKPPILMTVGGRVVRWDGFAILFTSGMTIDADGSPRAYAPRGSGLRGLDDLDNAGYPGNWWGIATALNGRPIVQDAGDPAPGFYISTTAYVRSGFRATDPRRYLDAETVPFIVVPGPLRKRVAPVVLGCLARVTNLQNGRTCEAVVGDIGPATHLGEGSIALAHALGIPSDPRRGGIAVPCIDYTIYPGVAAPGFELQPA